MSDIRSYRSEGEEKCTQYGMFAYIDLPYNSTKCRQIYHIIHIYMDPMGMYQIFVYSKSGSPKISRMFFCLIQTKGGQVLLGVCDCIM